MSHPCGGYIDLFYYKSPRYVGFVVKALEGREERQGLDLRRCVSVYSRVNLCLDDQSFVVGKNK